MSDLKIESITQVDHALMAPLMDREEQCWLSELDWNYAPIRKIIASFIGQRLLPGYVASRGREACGYTYFLIQHHKGIIGTLFASAPDAQGVAERVIAEDRSGPQSLQPKGIREMDASLGNA